MTNTNQIYPTLEDDGTRMQLYKQRSDKIIYEIKQLQDKSKHYAKVAKKWNKACRIVEELSDVFLILCGLSATTLAAVSTAGVAIPVFITIILSGAPIIELGIIKSIKHTAMKKRQEKYSKKSKLISDYVNRVWLYYEKAKQDGIISTEELEGFIKLIDELNAKLETEFSGVGDSLDMNLLRKQAEMDVKKELNKEFLEKLKQEMRQKYSAAS